MISCEVELSPRPYRKGLGTKLGWSFIDSPSLSNYVSKALYLFMLAFSIPLVKLPC